MQFRRFRALVVPALLAVAVLASSCSGGSDAGVNETAASSVTMSQSDAAQQLVDQAFLPPATAACVVDAIFAATGNYDPNTDDAQAAIADQNLVAACSEPAASVGQDDSEADAGANGAPSVATARLPRFELTDASMPAISPGGLATGTVEIDGKTIDYVTVTPPGFIMGDTAPVFLALPPGGQDLTITRNVVDAVYMDQAVSRGWVVISPATPGGRWFDPENVAVVPELLSWMQAWVTPESGKPHIGGMSNGGLSAFHIALQLPDRFQSLLAFPGFPPTDEDRAAIRRLADMPVRMWVGGEDTRWVAQMVTAETSLRDVGGDVQLWVLPGEPHVINSTQDGVAFFDELDDARLG